jgi:hypothetical protein
MMSIRLLNLKMIAVYKVKLAVTAMESARTVLKMAAPTRPRRAP